MVIICIFVYLPKIKTDVYVILSLNVNNRIAFEKQKAEKAMQ